MVIIYLSPEKIIELNSLILTMINVKKADSAKVLSYGKLTQVIEDCKNEEGDIYDKAVVLLKGIVQKHAFASGNRRTAFIVAKQFLIENNAKIRISDDPIQSKIMLGIREGYYVDKEIKEWIKNGKIREFRREN